MQTMDMLLEPVRGLMLAIGAFVPRLLLGALVLLLGVVVAKAARFAVRRGLRAINFHVVTRRAGLDDLLQKGGAEIDTSDLFAALAYWAVILAALIVAFNSMGLSQVTELLGRLMVFVPRLFIALVLLTLGSYFAGFVGNAVGTYGQAVGLPEAHALGRLARYAVVAFVLIVALDQLDLGGDIVREAFLILLGGLVLALALAFGLGGRRWAAAQLERWWPSEQPPRTPAPRSDRFP